jgi:hypothetical protein
MVENSQTIDFIAHNPQTDRVALAMVEYRSWGDKGALLPDLQKKLNTYLGYVLNGQLAQDQPALKDKKVAFILQTEYPLSPREEQFVDIVQRKVLSPRDITLEIRLIGSSTQKNG